MVTSDEQALKCLTAPDGFAPVPNAWGHEGCHDRDERAANRLDARAAEEEAASPYQLNRKPAVIA